MEQNIVINSKDLKHSGIKGQKWGERRYQNEDGTYTEEGKQRRRKGSDDYLRSRQLMKKGIRNLSNKELQDINNRQNLERTYNQNNMGIGKKFVGQFEKALLGAAAGALAAVTIKKGKEFIASLKG